MMMEKETLGGGDRDHDIPPPDPSLIAHHWHHLAALGRDGYQRHGRGAVVIPAHVDHDLIQAKYVSDASLEQLERETGSRWPTEEIARRIQTYNTEAEIVVIVMHDDGRAQSYRVMGIAQPPDAATMRLN